MTRLTTLGFAAALALSVAACGASRGERALSGGAIGAGEMLISTAVCGVLWALFSGGPLIIMGGIGPLLIFTIILGFEVISKVPTVLHTPLMSGANAISGVVIIGAILLIRQADPDDYLTLSLGFLGVVLGMVNVAGGFAVTDRMLEMFKKKKAKKSRRT